MLSLCKTKLRTSKNTLALCSRKCTSGRKDLQLNETICFSKLTSCLPVCALSLQSCLPLCDPMDCSLPASSVHGISQARILKLVAISFSRGSSQPRDWTHVSCIDRWVLYHWTTWETKGEYCYIRKILGESVVDYEIYLFTILWKMQVKTGISSQSLLTARLDFSWCNSAESGVHGITWVVQIMCFLFHLGKFFDF